MALVEPVPIPDVSHARAVPTVYQDQDRVATRWFPEGPKLGSDPKEDGQED